MALAAVCMGTRWAEEVGSYYCAADVEQCAARWATPERLGRHVGINHGDGECRRTYQLDYPGKKKSWDKTDEHAKPKMKLIPGIHCNYCYGRK